MPANNPHRYALQNLLSCQLCQSPMRVTTGPLPEDDVYRCSRLHRTSSSSCAAPDVRARQFENSLIQDLCRTVFTPQNIKLLRDYLIQAGCNPKDLDLVWLTETATDPLTFTAVDATPIAQQLFAKFIDRITVNGTEATVNFSMPLPQDGILPGAKAQTITLPVGVIT